MERFEMCGEFVIRAVEMAEPQYIQGYSGRGVVGAGGLRCDEIVIVSQICFYEYIFTF